MIYADNHVKGTENKETSNMGMGASQARLLALTSRQHNIGRQLQHLSLEKMSLTREMQKISKNYNLALQGKVLKWSNNAGIDYVDLTYSTLMRPNRANGNKPVLLTNSAGKIIIDQKYKEFAQLISQDGKAGGDWQSNRVSILSKLTGISESVISSAASSEQSVYTGYNTVNSNRSALGDAENKAFSNLSALSFAKKWGSVGGFDFSKSTGEISLGSKSAASGNLKSYLSQIAQNAKQYLEEKDFTIFQTACNSFHESMNEIITNYSEKDNSNSPISGNDKDLKLDSTWLIEHVLTLYESNGGSTVTDKNGKPQYKIIKDGIDSDSYKAYQNAVANYDSSVENYETTVDSDNQILTADQESLIKFYDQLFTAIVENGWVEDSSVSDNDYLNQMLQNNEYYITTMSENNEENIYDSNNNKKVSNEYTYSTDLWSDTANIFAVNDEYIRQEALTDYEYEKSIISAKESRIDERMKNLETEQSAIKQMIQGVEQVRNNNVETHFNIFT